jgi:transposase
MEGTAVVVGIDVSKDRLDVHVRPSGETLTVERTAAGLDALCPRLQQIAPRLVALEATGGFETIATAALAAAGLPVVVVNPAQVRSFARALGRRAETDPIDAAVIAHFAAATEVEVRPLKDEATRLLGELVGRRRQITEMIRAEHNRARRITEPRLRKSIARLAEALERELAVLDADIDTAVRGSPLWRATEDLLTSVPGVGPVIARTLIAELPELGLLDRKKLASLVGHAPVRQVERPRTQRHRLGPGQDGAVHGRHGRQAVQPHPQGLLRAPSRRGQAEDGRHHRRRPKTPDYPQRRHEGPASMAKRLTSKTVAPAARSVRRACGWCPSPPPAAAR